jgi:hypothetical protein
MALAQSYCKIMAIRLASKIFGLENCNKSKNRYF